MYMGMPPSLCTESRRMWKKMTNLKGCHGGSMSSSLGVIMGGSFMAPCATPIGPRGDIQNLRAFSGISRANTPSVWSAAMSGSVHMVSMTEPGLQ